nr:MAG TPA: hypothetical protein [Bacteriophage sp.]
MWSSYIHDASDTLINSSICFEKSTYYPKGSGDYQKRASW